MEKWEKILFYSAPVLSFIGLVLLILGLYELIVLINLLISVSLFLFVSAFIFKVIASVARKDKKQIVKAGSMYFDFVFLCC